MDEVLEAGSTEPEVVLELEVLSVVEDVGTIVEVGSLVPDDESELRDLEVGFT